ncbi:MAG TPA: dTDP-4-dehydrorhamnose 3,5-epimerase family protein [Geminicoccaceae bacterium]|nr:dTDP-4-dehydrorhamnose 3,5-epimerase family protein [Geminicoccaceae bacterium]
MAGLRTGRLRVLARPMPGVLLLQSEAQLDERGAFARCFCRTELRALGVDCGVDQANLSFSAASGTLRGLHYQLGASAETKIVTCLAGALFDVVLDLRPDSPTFGRHFAAELTAASRRVVVVPEGCAHGFLTLADATSVLYLASAPYDPVRERGVRWDDPAFEIDWPIVPRMISARDRGHPDFDPGYHLAA